MIRGDQNSSSSSSYVYSGTVLAARTSTGVPGAWHALYDTATVDYRNTAVRSAVPGIKVVERKISSNDVCSMYVAFLMPDRYSMGPRIRNNPMRIKAHFFRGRK